LRAHSPQIEVKHNPRDQLMPERGTLSVDKARRLLGYAPAYPLERGFVGYLDWYKTIAAKNPQLLRPQ
jgi:nucleoside-diphosphate-sugar epimerase